MRTYIIVAVSLLSVFVTGVRADVMTTMAENCDSTQADVNTKSHGQWAIQASANLSKVFNNDDGMKEFVHSHAVNYYDARLKWRAAPDTSDPYDVGMGRPHLMGGVMYADYSRLNIKREEREYKSQIGQIITVYGGAQFDILHLGRWTLDVDIRNGIGFCPHPYNERKNRDQEIIGSVYSIYVAGGVHVGYRLTPHWKASAGLDMQHYSNGTLDRPNIGANTGGFTVAVSYDFEPQPLRHAIQNDAKSWMQPWEKEIYLEATAGIALKALSDRFDITHSSHNPVYGSFTTLLAPMWRYHRLHATGIGIDYTYANYVYKIKEYDAVKNNLESKYSPHILGVSLRHEVFYKHVSVNVGVGAYLNKKTGHSAVLHESMSYQNVGFRYSLPFTDDRLFLGYNVKAHNFSKVDCVQFLTGYRIKLK